MNMLEFITAAAALPRERSEALPAGAYNDPSFADFERTEIFHKEWISLCHLSQLKTPGDFVRVDVADEPLIVVRGKDDEIRVLSRTCRHRGMDVMPTGFGHPDEGNRRVILCPYHLWSYDLTGKLLGAPEMQKAEGFDRSELCLHSFRSEIWEGFVFVNLSGDAPPLSESLADLTNRFVGKWHMAEAEMVWSAHWDCPFNWKVLVENFMECYHHLGAHRKTLEPFLPAKGCWTEPITGTAFSPPVRKPAASSPRCFYARKRNKSPITNRSFSAKSKRVLISTWRTWKCAPPPSEA